MEDANANTIRIVQGGKMKEEDALKIEEISNDFFSEFQIVPQVTKESTFQYLFFEDEDKDFMDYIFPLIYMADNENFNVNYIGYGKLCTAFYSLYIIFTGDENILEKICKLEKLYWDKGLHKVKVQYDPDEEISTNEKIAKLLKLETLLQYGRREDLEALCDSESEKCRQDLLLKSVDEDDLDDYEDLD